MKVLLEINLLVVICILLNDSVTINELTQESLYYKDQIKILYQLLAAECPDELRHKREISGETISSIKLRAQKLHYNNLLKTLSECKMKKQSQTKPVQQHLSTTNLAAKSTKIQQKATESTTPTAKPTTVKPTTAKPTTAKPTTAKPTTAKRTAEPKTTLQPLPAPCLSAATLTDSWRMDHDGKDLRGGGPKANALDRSDGYACDFRQDLQWFRFSGAAGK